MKKYTQLLSVLFIVLVGSMQVKAQGVVDVNTQLSHNWIISALVIDGGEVAPPALNMNDRITINADNTLDMIINGEGFAGTWSVTANGMFITIVLSESNAMRLKIVELSDTKLIVDYVAADYVHTVLAFTH